MKDKLKLSIPFIEEFVYVIACICTFGGVWLLKIVIRKAIVDSKNVKK